MLALREKLTLYYLAILSLILLIFGVAIYTYTSRGLLSTIDESLSYQVEKLVHMRVATNSGEDNSDILSGNNDLEQNFSQISPQVVQIIDESGQITDETPELLHKYLPIDITQLRKLPVGTNEFETVRIQGGEEVRIATRRAMVHLESEGTYFIRLGQSLAPLQAARRRLLIMLWIAIPLVLLLGSVGGRVLSNQALLPVDRIRRVAEQIGEGDLSERVPSTGKMDEIGRLAATFNHMISRLQAAFERQKQFTSDASHELRTPLAVMRGELEITLRRDRPPEEYRRVLTSNLEEILRLSRLIEDMLVLARADGGRIELKLEPVDLNRFCQQMVEYITPLALQREQALMYEPEMAPDQAVVINADLQQIKQLFLNLLDNAIKYTDLKGAVTLGLKTEDKQAVITIVDTGRGIPAEDLPHIFERFFRRSAPTSDRSAPGSGLGLSIVKWIVESHKGKIEARSEIGKGTSFIVKIPLAHG